MKTVELLVFPFFPRPPGSPGLIYCLIIIAILFLQCLVKISSFIPCDFQSFVSVYFICLPWVWISIKNYLKFLLEVGRIDLCILMLTKKKLDWLVGLSQGNKELEQDSEWCKLLWHTEVFARGCWEGLGLGTVDGTSPFLGSPGALRVLRSSGGVCWACVCVGALSSPPCPLPSLKSYGWITPSSVFTAVSDLIIPQDHLGRFFGSG